MALRHLMAGTALVVISGSAVACDLESFGASEYLAQYDYSQLEEQARREAQQRALQIFHEQKMAEAKTSFLTRFKLNTADQAPPATASVN